MNLNVYFSVWLVLTVVVLAMAAYRYLLVRHADATIDLMESSKIAAEQTKAFRRAEGIGRWGKILTAVVLVYGLALIVVLLHHAWQVSLQVAK
jgi:hypothetical protein